MAMLKVTSDNFTHLKKNMEAKVITWTDLQNIHFIKLLSNDITRVKSTTTWSEWAGMELPATAGSVGSVGIMFCRIAP